MSSNHQKENEAWLNQAEINQERQQWAAKSPHLERVTTKRRRMLNQIWGLDIQPERISKRILKKHEQALSKIASAVNEVGTQHLEVQQHREAFLTLIRLLKTKRRNLKKAKAPLPLILTLRNILKTELNYSKQFPHTQKEFSAIMWQIEQAVLHILQKL